MNVTFILFVKKLRMYFARFLESVDYPQQA